MQSKANITLSVPLPFHQLPGECLRWLVGRLQGLGRGAVRVSCKVALLSSDVEVQRAVVQAVMALEEVRIKKDMRERERERERES